MSTTYVYFTAYTRKGAVTIRLTDNTLEEVVPDLYDYEKVPWGTWQIPWARLVRLGWVEFGENSQEEGAKRKTKREILSKIRKGLLIPSYRSSFWPGGG
ncbi:MAG: hypothetical protein WCG84_01195 [Candidatus Moraniibacteriota bacterium]